MDEYTLADLERMTGAKRRSLQLWADAGVIQSSRDTDRAGTGTHRRFSRSEAIIGCIVRGFAERQMAIGELLAIAKMIREFFRVDDRVMPIIESTIRGEEDWMLVLETWVEGGPRRPPPLRLVPGVESLRIAFSTWLETKFGLIRPGRSVSLAKIMRVEDEAEVLLPVRFFEKPEHMAITIRLRTYLSKIES